MGYGPMNEGANFRESVLIGFLANPVLVLGHDADLLGVCFGWLFQPEPPEQLATPDVHKDVPTPREWTHLIPDWGIEEAGNHTSP